MKHKLYSQRFFKKWLAAAAVGLLAVIAISSPVNAETFTLLELSQGESFTIGAVTFLGWTFDADDSTVNPAIVTIDTIDDPNLPGFRVNGNGELVGDETRLVYSFDVVTVDNVMAGGLLWLTAYEVPLENGEINIDLRDDSVEVGLELEVFVNRDRGEIKLIDAGSLSDAVAALAFDADVKLDLNDTGIIKVDTFETRIVLLFEGRTNFDFLPGAVYFPLLLNN